MSDKIYTQFNNNEPKLSFFDKIVLFFIKTQYYNDFSEHKVIKYKIYKNCLYLIDIHDIEAFTTTKKIN